MRYVVFGVNWSYFLKACFLPMVDKAFLERYTKCKLDVPGIRIVSWASCNSVTNPGEILGWAEAKCGM